MAQRSKLKILVLEDEEENLFLLRKMFAANSCPWEVVIVEARTAKDFRKLIKNTDFDFLIIDLLLDESGPSGLELYTEFRQARDSIPCVVVSGDRTFESVRNSLRTGVKDYLLKGFGKEELFHVMQRCLDQARLERIEKIKLEEDQVSIKRSGVMIGCAPSMTLMRAKAEKFAGSEAPILIEGETGTGKELVARSIHNQSQVRNGPFIAVDCGAIPSELAESFFFGHEKGSFTGSMGRQIGVLEQANGGTLFLDEVNSLAPAIQSKLLRALQGEEFFRVGARNLVKSNFRLLSATNQNLLELVKRSKFRRDLYYRLNVLRLLIPPLRNRVEDIPLLLDSFLGSRSLSETVKEFFLSYDWPGNVRELKNLCQSLKAIVAPSNKVCLEHLKEVEFAGLGESKLDSFKPRSFKSTESLEERLIKVREQLKEGEREVFLSAYLECGQKVGPTALRMGVDRSYLHHKLVAWGIHQPRKSGSPH